MLIKEIDLGFCFCFIFNGVELFSSQAAEKRETSSVIGSFCSGKHMELIFVFN